MIDQKIHVAVDIIVSGKKREGLVTHDTILLIKRHPKSNAFPNHWALPGGLVNDDETIVDAAIRECLEETGLDIDVEFLWYEDGIKRDPRGRAISFIFQGSLYTNILKAGDDAVDAKYYSMKEIEEMGLAFDHKKIIRHYFARTAYIDDNKDWSF